MSKISETAEYDIEALDLALSEERVLEIRDDNIHWTGSDSEDRILSHIFKRTYHREEESSGGKRDITARRRGGGKRTISAGNAAAPQLVLVDGYNMLFGWQDTKELPEKESMESARTRLLDMLVTYRLMQDTEVVVVFDAYRVKGNLGSEEDYHGIRVIYTKEGETADAYIEKLSAELNRQYRLRVATSDSIEQMIAYGHGAKRMSGRELEAEVKSAEKRLRELVAQTNVHKLTATLGDNIR